MTRALQYILAGFGLATLLHWAIQPDLPILLFAFWVGSMYGLALGLIHFCIDFCLNNYE